MSEKLKAAGFPQHTSYFSWGYDKTGEKLYLTDGTASGDGVGRIADAPQGAAPTDDL